MSEHKIKPWVSFFLHTFLLFHEFQLYSKDTFIIHYIKINNRLNQMTEGEPNNEICTQSLFRCEDCKEHVNYKKLVDRLNWREHPIPAFQTILTPLQVK